MRKWLLAIAGLISLTGCREQECEGYRQVAQELLYTHDWTVAAQAARTDWFAACAVLRLREPYFQKAARYFREGVFQSHLETRCATLPQNDSFTHWERQCGLWPKEGYADVYYVMEEMAPDLESVSRGIASVCTNGNADSWATDGLVNSTERAWSNGHRFYSHECKGLAPYPGVLGTLPDCASFKPNQAGGRCRTEEGFVFQWLGRATGTALGKSVSAGLWKDETSGLVLTDLIDGGEGQAHAVRLCQDLKLEGYSGFSVPSQKGFFFETHGGLGLLLSTGVHGYGEFWTTERGWGKDPTHRAVGNRNSYSEWDDSLAVGTVCAVSQAP